MTLPNDINMPGYFIYRDSPVDQPFDAMAPLAFFPPKDSDELFDALRAEFPHLKTHSERMREATIAYLMQERNGEQSPVPMPTPLTADTATTSPWLPSFPSMSNDSSTFSSPDMLELSTPSFGSPLQAVQPQLTRQPSVAGPLAPTTTTPPALEQMTGVFSLSESTQPKQRIRRKMTEAEKTEYRKRRIVKACDKCSKRKRKCNHNQPEMESLSKSSQKIEKTKPAAHHKKPSVIPMSLSRDPDDRGPSQPFIQGDDWFDFTLLDDPMPEMTFDDLLQADLDKPLEKQQYIQNQWPWGTDTDFSVMFQNDTPLQNTHGDGLEGRPHARDLTQQQGLLFDDPQADGSTLRFTTGNKKYPVGVQPQQQAWSGADGNGMLWSEQDTQQDLRAQQARSRAGRKARADGTLRESPGIQQQATQTLQHSLQANNARSGDAVFFDGHVGGTVGGWKSCGATAPRKESTRSIKNPRIDVVHDFPDGDDRYVHQSESTTKEKRDRTGQANEQNRANVRSVEGSSTKDLMQAAAIPQSRRTTGTTEKATLDGLKTAIASRAVDPAAELYRLRRRVPRVEPLLQARPQTPQSLSRDHSQVTGGAYLQLDTGSSATPNLTGLSAILPAIRAEKPVHTRARHRIESSSSDDVNPRTETSTPAEGTSASALSHSSRPRAHGRSPLRSRATPQSVSASGDSSCDSYQERLHDTVRYRDHFGRVAVRICAALLGGLLLFCAARTSALAPSTLLLALLAPSFSAQNGSSKMRHRESASADSWASLEGKTNAIGCHSRIVDFDGPSGLEAKARGWVMTPHSSIRWSVRTA